jgi:hypothetical protein
MESSIKIKFGDYRQLPVVRDGLDFLFHFTTVDTKYIGAPEEFRLVEPHQLVVGISGTLQTMWGLQGMPLVKTLFELGKRHIIDKIKDGTLTSKTELQLATSNAPQQAPFDTNRIPDPKGVEVIVARNKPNLSDNQEGLRLGGDIVDILDNINAIFHDHFGHLLFVPQEFRATLELVRPANTKEEYIVRVISLAQLIDRLNLPALRKLTGENDSHVKSISLLEKFLISIGGMPEPAIQTLRSLVRLRQGYPVHTDTADGVREAHKFLGLGYPVTEFQQSWPILLNHFLQALQLIKKNIEQHSERDTSGG